MNGSDEICWIYWKFLSLYIQICVITQFSFKCLQIIIFDEFDETGTKNLRTLYEKIETEPPCKRHIILQCRWPVSVRVMFGAKKSTCAASTVYWFAPTQMSLNALSSRGNGELPREMIMDTIPSPVTNLIRSVSLNTLSTNHNAGHMTWHLVGSPCYLFLLCSRTWQMWWGRLLPGR
jgi:hypothetical protein